MHALNSVLALFEIICTHAGPAPWIHIPFLIILAACYLAVAYITHATQGFYSTAGSFSECFAAHILSFSIFILEPTNAAREAGGMDYRNCRGDYRHFLDYSHSLRYPRKTCQKVFPLRCTSGRKQYT